jgi:hypothetical protein
MRKMNVILVVLGGVVVVGAVAGTAAAVAFGCWFPGLARYEDETSSPVAITEIRVTGGTVTAEVRPGAATGVTVHRTVSYMNPLQGKPGATYRIDGATLELRGDDSVTLSKVDYVVTAPEGVKVVADIATGYINVAGVSTVDAKVSTGSVTVTGATGDVTARADTGSITGVQLRSGSVVAITKTGGVSLDLAVPADVEAITSMGAVELTVPAGDYRIDAQQKSGKPSIGLASDPNGAHRLTLRTDMGGIRLATR